MADEKRGSENFDSDKFLRRLERERRLKEIEQSFQNIAEEAQKKQDDIYSNVFTEKGQEETLASHGGMEVNTAFQPSQNTTNSAQNGIFSRMTEMISPSRQNLVQKQPTIEMSPTGVSSFPDVEPVGESKKSRKPFWNNDGPGIGARMTNATVQDTILHSFFSVRANSKKIVIGILVFCFIILLSVTLANVKKSPQHDLSEAGLRKLEEIKSILDIEGVDKNKLNDINGPHFDAAVWLAKEATTFNEMFVGRRRLLVERFALLVFYYSARTANSPWKNESNWLSKGISVCFWRGVDCDSVESDDDDMIEVVVGIDLSSNKLSGIISDEISKLASLRTLRLSDNSLEGSIPASFGNLKYLETFEVGENLLSGQMPLSVCNLRDFRLTDIITDCTGFSCSCCNECG